jgi:hypothetical protein
VTALRELDGTFVATRKIQGFVLVRFQNPPILDFMQSLLLAGEQLSEIIESLVFFEQSQWFMTTLIDDRPRVSITVLSSHAHKVVDAMMALIDAVSCTVHVSGDHPSHRVLPQCANPAGRLASVALAVASQSERNDAAWIEARLSELSARVEAGTISPSIFDGPLRELANVGCLSSDSGKHLVSAIKQRVLTDLDELDGFEALGNLISAVPNSLVGAELESARQVYAKFAERFVEDCDSDNPDEIRSDAARIGNVGEILGVDTDTEQTTLRDFASEIESENEKPRLLRRPTRRATRHRLFATLGWQTVSALEETFGAGGTLGRETKGEVVLVERLRAALANSTRPCRRRRSATPSTN